MKGPGHNSKAKPRGVDVVDGQLAAFVQRIVRLHEERKTLGSDIAEVFAEVRGEGYDVPTVRRVVQRQLKDEAEVSQADELLAVYEAAILRALSGMDGATRAPARGAA